MIAKIRSDHPNVILLDCGDTFDHQKNYPELRAQTIWSAMKLMQYDAVNLAEGELSLGLSFLDKRMAEDPLPLISVNPPAFDNNGGLSYIKPYVVKKVGTIRVGVIGGTLGTFYDELSSRFSLKQPQDVSTAMLKWLPSVRQQSDIVVFLSHLGFEGTKAVIASGGMDRVDVAIAGHGRKLTISPEMVNDTIIVQNSMGGEYLGELILRISSGKKIVNMQGRNIALTDDVPEDQRITKKMAGYENRRRAERRTAEKNQQLDKKIEEMREKYLHLSPQEFVDEMKKEGRAFNLSTPPPVPAPSGQTANPPQ